MYGDDGHDDVKGTAMLTAKKSGEIQMSRLM